MYKKASDNTKNYSKLGREKWLILCDQNSNIIQKVYNG